MSREILCVIRHVNERTEEKSFLTAEKLFKKTIKISKTPFFEAVKETFVVGASFPDFPFLLALDADVVLKEEACSLILSEWDKYQKTFPSLFRLDFLVQDKFRGRVYAGCHLYLNKHSKDVVSFLKKKGSSTTQKRPESSNVRAFASEFGLKSKDGKVIVGTHDFEQYYEHIYAKYLNRAIRDRDSFLKIQKMIIEKKEKHPEDFDFVIALAALDAVEKGEFKEMNTNAKLYPSIQKILDNLGITEKSPLNV